MQSVEFHVYPPPLGKFTPPLVKRSWEIEISGFWLLRILVDFASSRKFQLDVRFQRGNDSKQCPFWKISRLRRAKTSCNSDPAKPGYIYHPLVRTRKGGGGKKYTWNSTDGAKFRLAQLLPLILIISLQPTDSFENFQIEWNQEPSKKFPKPCNGLKHGVR